MTTGPTDPTVAPQGAPAAPPPGVPPATPVGAADTDVENQSLGSLIGQVTSDLSTLFRQEVQLAKAELAQSAKNAGKGAGMFSGAAVAGHFVLLFLSLALAWGLNDLFDSEIWGFIVTALLWGVVAAVLASKGRSEIKKVEGAPQTAETVKKIPNALKGHEEENR